MSYPSTPKKQNAAVVAPNLLPSLAKLLDDARLELGGGQATAMALLTRATSLVRVEIDRQAATDEPARTGGGLTSWQARRLTVFIDARLDRPIKLKELAEVSKLSTAYFCRAFKRTFNETPHSYIVSRRLSKAETLMLTSDFSLSNIAASCGFADQAHLCKLFRQQYARSPAAWRRERTEVCSRRAKVEAGDSFAPDPY
jgi:AraC family transcriptional regulator